ncbi:MULTISPECIES: helix-turn-helix domain-containing protein [unclassified Brevundimonas]|jgi:excisionase family DNA binding protein|uniref:helix-turn-helix domain-containing protein n=1 Tax=unclassified Brevundimonas TaxID=2622653 RepID=UPI000C4D5EA8|nr:MULTISPECIES: helix-turn-helix domain-containing protein [unclassified Brevundimonas]MAL87793.1 hypothetical protein [Brevundimonas sp.]HAJ02300.1 hypothetical protein [Brevundimonas sp.]HAV49533.1 hypothetical protein [Brevundimonas sp.]|tara:strand:- start:1731 stop:1913 length:183 start_codon:yes stop_codon:yes gene_type:complete
MNTEPVALSIPDAVRYCGLSRTRLYELIQARELPSAKVGKRRIIRRADLDALIDRHMAVA